MSLQKKEKNAPRNLTRSIPNLFTASALSCGMIALLTLNTTHENTFIWFFLGAVFFDLMDGRVARWMHQESALGAELDSLCDMVTFGALPAVAYYHFVFHQLTVFWVPALIFYTWSTALRLARFNLSTEHDNFSGLPCPVAAIFVLTFLWAHDAIFGMMPTPFLSAAIILIAGWLQISNIPYIAFKKITSKTLYGISLAAILFILASFFIDLAIAIWLSALLYILWGFTKHFKLRFIKKKNKTPKRQSS